MSNLDRQLKAYEIASAMRDAGVDEAFAVRAAEVSKGYEGVFDLMVLWCEAEDSEADRDETLADLQELLDDIEHTPERRELDKVPYEALATVADEIMAFKRDLRAKVEQWGGISKLARATGMPQPSLSRFFNTASMPRRTTLYKIARALGLADQEIDFRHTS